MESQAESERQQKDTAKRELESRLEEMSKRKSKFNVSTKLVSNTRDTSADSYVFS
jgi:hypothetical protein